MVTLTFDLDIRTQFNSSEPGTKHVFPVNLAQIRSAVPEIFHAETTKSDRQRQKELYLMQFTVRIKNKQNAAPCGVTGQLADTPTCGLPTRGLDNLRTGQVADWTTRGCHQRLCMLSFRSFGCICETMSCPVREMSSPPVV